MSSPDLPASLEDAVLAPIDAGARSELVARKLTRAIQLGLLPGGAQLPSEAELAARLAVSTVTLRAALAQLRSDGLVETRRGRGGGTVVRPPDESMPQLMGRQLEQVAVDDLRDLGDLCAVLRGGTAGLAAARAGPSEVERLEEQVMRLQQADGDVSWRHAEGRFHVELAAAAHSPRLARAELGLQAEAGELLLLPDDRNRRRATVVARFREILAAVARHDDESATAHAQQHVAETVARLVALHLERVSA